MSEKKDNQSAYLKLTPKRRAFVDAYFELKFNGKQAAIKAGYSKKTAREQAARLLTNVIVKKAIEERRAIIEEDNKLEVSEVVESLRGIASTNILDVCSWKNGELTIKDSSVIPRELGAYIAEITQTPTEHGSRIKIKFYDKVKALELLGRYLKMFTDRHEVAADGLTLIWDDRNQSDA
jgi:phage terminase small subunit